MCCSKCCEAGNGFLVTQASTCRWMPYPGACQLVGAPPPALCDSKCDTLLPTLHCSLLPAGGWPALCLLIDLSISSGNGIQPVATHLT